MGRPMSGWFKLWRSAVQLDMELSPHEFRLWYLLQTLALHSDANQMQRGTLETSYSELRCDLCGGMPSDRPSYSYATLSRALTRLVDTGRIVRLAPGRGRQNRLRFRIKEWNGMQRGQYDLMLGRNQHGWLKLWRWAVYYEDMQDLSPAEFKLWLLLQSMAAHTDTDKQASGTVRTSYNYLSTALTDLTYKPGKLRAMLTTLEGTKRIQFTADKDGNLRVRIQEWNLSQKGNLDKERWDSV